MGVNAVDRLAAWLAALPASEQVAVRALQLANEPALGTPTSSDDSPTPTDHAIHRFYTRAHAAARAHLPTTPLVLSFMGPSLAVTNFVKQLAEQDESEGKGGGLPVVVDHHYYLNWQLPEGCYAWDGSCQMTWAQVHERACMPATHPVLKAS